MIDKVLKVLNIRNKIKTKERKKHFSLRLLFMSITRFGLSPPFSGHSTLSRIETRL